MLPTGRPGQRPPDPRLAGRRDQQELDRTSSGPTTTQPPTAALTHASYRE